MPPSYSTRFLILLSVLVPLAIFSGGCVWLMFPRGFYDVSSLNETCCNPLVAEDTAPRSPPADVLWTWMSEKARRGPEGYILPVIDPPAVAADLRRYLVATPGATAAVFLRSLGMSCVTAGARSPCVYDLPVGYVCARQKPVAQDFERRREGRIHILVVASADAIESASSTLQKSNGTVPCFDP